MNYQDILSAARDCIGPHCRACGVCDGRACGSTMPGPGAKGSGSLATANFRAWQSIYLNMDTICENKPADCSAELFGRRFALPLFAAPVGNLPLHYGSKYSDTEYNDILLSACAGAGIAAFTGDGSDDSIMRSAAAALEKHGGCGVPTIKPWNRDKVMEKLELVKKARPFAIAMDIDAAGLPFLKNMTPPAGSKTIEELAEIAAAAELPFIVKGIMTVKGAEKAAAAGAAGIVVSNHGGRVLDCCPPTAQVLPEIAEAIGSRLTVLVDGGIRSGIDIFKALALGAHGVLIARPFVSMVYGGGSEGVALYVEKLRAELEDCMLMCGAHSIGEISRDMVRIGK